LSDLECSSDEDDQDDEIQNEDTVLGKLNNGDEPSWVMATGSKMVKQSLEIFPQRFIKL
jgi:hypothetical protein